MVHLSTKFLIKEENGQIKIKFIPNYTLKWYINKEKADYYIKDAGLLVYLCKNLDYYFTAYKKIKSKLVNS